LDNEENEHFDERSQMLRREEPRRLNWKPSKAENEEWSDEVDRMGRASVGSGESSVSAVRGRYTEEDHPRLVALKDAGGRDMPAAERAPAPRIER
jgi:hypothetical protein